MLAKWIEEYLAVLMEGSHFSNGYFDRLFNKNKI
jgi:hypothetical protein